MASLHIKPYIIAVQLQLCTGREDYPCVGAGGGVVSRKKGARSMGEAKKEGGKKLTSKINMKKRGKKLIYK